MFFLQVFKENSIKEENEESFKLEDLSHDDALFKEETQNTEDSHYLGLCTENIPSTVVHNKDEKLSNELDCVDYTDSKKVNSSKKNKPLESSVFEIITAGDSVSEYITSDSIGLDPNPTSSTSGETESMEAKLNLPPLEKISDNNIDKVIGKRPHTVARIETEASLSSVYNKEGRSRSSLRDSDDSGSDWEQEYLASKNVCSKSKSVIKRSIQGKQDHKVSEKYPC